MPSGFGKSKKVLVLFILAGLVVSRDLYAGDKSGDDISIHWILLTIGLLGGLGLFLYGMEKMSLGMRKTAGIQMRSILTFLTGNRFIALIVGAFVTMVIQSSSATTVMLVGFVQAGLMDFARTLGVILGADIGTTVTAQLIAFNVTDYALLMVGAGFAVRMFSRSRKAQNIGEVILGFGILFLGMKLMSDTMSPLRGYKGFIDIISHLQNPLTALFAGMVFTALIQSSSAFVGIVIVLAQQGLVTLESGIPMILGANIGTCITAVLACIGVNREAKRVAIAHVLFKVSGVLVFVFWIPAFSEIVRFLTAGLNVDVARQIANAHTIFNVSLGLAFLPMTPFFAALISRLFPDKKKFEEIEPAVWHLDEARIITPDIAISLARSEISRMAKLLWRMMRAVIIPFVSDERLIKKEASSRDEREMLLREIPRRDEFFPRLSLIDGIRMRENKIDFLEQKVGEYLLKIVRLELSEEQSSEVYGMMSIVKDIESIGDIIHRNMLPLIYKKQQLDSDFSNDGKEELMIYHEKVCSHLILLMESFLEVDPKKARRIMENERVYLDLELQYRVRHLERLRYEQAESLETHEVHMDLMDLMKQIIVYTSNIAKTFIETSSWGR